jgi:prepilin-type N-terminal cleavage/methylation domain-containing protein
VILAAGYPTSLSLTKHVRSRGSRRGGFSLIEVLLALAIFLMSLVAIARLVDMGTDREIDSQLQVRATRLAQSKMGEVVSGYLGPLSSLGSSSGDFDNDSAWSWNLTTETPPTPQTVPNLYLVTITVSRKDRGRHFQYVLSQMVIDSVMIGSPVAATSTTSNGSTTTALYPDGFTGTGSGGTTSGGSP